MRKNVVIAVVWTVVLGLALVTVAGEPYEDYFDQTYRVGPNPTVSLENINGDVSIDVWDGDEVQVQAVKRASSPELLEKLEIDVDVSGTSIDIETDYPSNRKGGRMSVEFTVLVPRQSVIDSVELVNGNLKIRGVEGGTNVEMVNGDVHAGGLIGSVSVETVNGAVEIALDRLQPGDHVSIEAVNGSIDVYLPAGAAVDLDAETVNGRLSNDLGIEVKKGKYVGASMHGQTGGGGAKISLESVNSSIAVHQR
jgi:DUF4097 and DUF4098 domain-containing protein YvlB